MEVINIETDAYTGVDTQTVTIVAPTLTTDMFGFPSISVDTSNFNLRGNPNLVQEVLEQEEGHNNTFVNTIVTRLNIRPNLDYIEALVQTDYDNHPNVRYASLNLANQQEMDEYVALVE